MRRLLYLALVAVIFAACSSEPQQPSGRPGENGIVPQEPEPDYSAALANPGLRFESDTLSLAFDAGGILYCVEGTEHRYIELSTGVSVTFDPSAPSLRVNGVKVNIDECRLIGADEGAKWYVILPDGDIVVTENS